MSIIQKTCQICQKSFNATISEHNRGNAKFCSQSCFGKYNSVIKTKPKLPNVFCATCQTPLYRKKTQINRCKSGLFFCNANCRNEAQRIHSNVDFKLSHYKSGKHIRYRYVLPDVSEMNCPICYRLLPITAIDVHHIDGNRSNNNPNNLFICCPTCHRLKHLKLDSY